MSGEEHWEVAAFADAFDDWASAPFRRTRRQSSKRLRFVAASIKLARCMNCGALAEWDYVAGKPMHYCDACVPRGCECRIVEADQHIIGETVFELGPDGEQWVRTRYDGPVPRQETDSLGRELPCIEWYFYAGGFPCPSDTES